MKRESSDAFAAQFPSLNSAQQTAPSPAGLADARSKPGRPPASARAMFRLLERIEHGSLDLYLPDGQRLSFGSRVAAHEASPERAAASGPHANIQLTNWNLFSATLRAGDIGFAQSYLDGDWSTDSLIAVLELATLNRDPLQDAIYGRWWGGLITRLRHLLNRNTRAGSRRNIHAHYDLGNPFYALWLDPSMTYSSALFDGNQTLTLEQAQQQKYRRILEELQPAFEVKPGETDRAAFEPAQTTRPGRISQRGTVLEIGCGWGGFAEAAARDGLTVRGLTLSKEQLAFATQRIDQAGLAEQVQLDLCDYRDEQGRYDAIASIEMFEAVGESYWPAYFQAVHRALAPHGRAVIQTITIADELFDRYRRGSDFIQQFVFPGGMLPTVSAFAQHAERAGLRVVRSFGFGQDYARTLQLWRERFIAQIDSVRRQGFDSRFERVWEFYLAYCEAGFRHRNIDVFQFTLEHAQRP